MLFVKCIRRNIPSRSGNRQISEIVSLSCSDRCFHILAKHLSSFVLPKFQEKNMDPCHYPYTYDAIYQEMVFEMVDEEDVRRFFSIFKHLKPPTDIAWLRHPQQPQNVVRVDNARQNAPFLFQTDQDGRKETKNFLLQKQIFPAVMTHLEVKIGAHRNKKRYCPFRITYTRDMDPFFPGGTLKLSYGYESNTHTFLNDVCVEGEERPEGQVVPEPNKQIPISKQDLDAAIFNHHFLPLCPLPLPRLHPLCPPLPPLPPLRPLPQL
jgi:hypothetical protein